MASVCCDIPGKSFVANGHGPAWVGVKAINLREGGGLIGAQCINLGKQKEACWIVNEGIVRRGLLSGTILVNQFR